MKTLQVETKNNYLHITLDRGRSNPINAEMADELRTVFQQLTRTETLRGAILAGKEPFFSVGLDVVELYDYDAETMNAFWLNFYHLMQEWISCPKPIVAAITGHSPAGGCVFSLCCDYRVMADGPYRIGLNEIPVGIVIPPGIYHLYAAAIGEPLAYHHIMSGSLLDPAEALRIGLVHEVVPMSEVLQRAEAKLQYFLSLNPVAWQESKRLLRRSLLHQISGDFETEFAATLAHWWSSEARAMLQTMIARLKK